ncbi:MAG: TolC family protein [Candidatus Omnitrophica bacterium]|nr:TolC family protein [Candidatus Omnitrophota bacterium]
MMKRILAVTIIFALILSCRPADVLSQGGVNPAAKPDKTVTEAKPVCALPSARASQLPCTEKGAPEVSVYMTGPVKTEKFSAPPLYPEAQVTNALTLPDCYRMALIQSEIIAINADLIKEADAHFMIALSTILPHVSFESSDFQEALPSQKGQALSSLKPNKVSTRNFNFTQTLFSGFKAIAGMRGAKYEKNQRIDEKIRAEQLLLVDVSDAFYLLLEKRADLNVLKRIRVVLDDRIKELIARERLGRSRPSEIVYVKTQLYSVEASIELVKSQEVVARQLLEFLVGQPVGPIADTYQFPDKLKPEEYYVAQSLARPDVQATKFAWQLSKENILVVESDFLPQVDVNGNYYTQRTGFYETTDWDIELKVSVPIFEGTEVLGNSNIARLQADEKMQAYHRARRKAPYDIRNAYIGLTTAMAVRDVMRKAYTTARTNAHMQIKDYDRRLVSNLDVLTAIQALENSERDYVNALYEAKRRYWQLRVAVGQSGTESLNDAF